MSFPAGSAPGPTGLRPAHLKDCLKRVSSSAILRIGMAAFVLGAIRGDLHGGIQQPLCTATLIPLKKKDGGIRPIAVGETLRRLVGKVLLQLPEVKQEMQTLKPRQCGVGVPFAAEMLGMAVQRLADGMLPEAVSSSWAHLMIDIKNAYNSLSRVAMLKGASRKAPTTYSGSRGHVPHTRP